MVLKEMTALLRILARQDPLDAPPPDDPTSNIPGDDGDDGHKDGAWEWVFFALFVLVVLSLIAYFVYSRLRARRLGLPPPSLNPFSDSNRIPSRNYPATGGVVGYVKGKWRNFKSGRRAGGAGYESTGHARARRNQFGALDPDEAWDARVGHEADEYGPHSGFEEQELGLASNQHNRTNARGYGPSGGVADVTRDRSPSRELNSRYEAATGIRSDVSPDDHNPFADHAEHSSLRGISPRPHEEPPAYTGSRRTSGDSPTNERRSIFRENV